MRILDLFAGIGGFSLAGHWLGWETVAFVEWDDYCKKVLTKNFPGVPIYGDIKQYRGQEGTADVICGGFPCQPFSQAGKRQGQADDRYLWPEMLRVIQEVKPRWVVGENVAGLITMEDGRTLERILTDLEDAGYRSEVFVIPACGVGAWHRRDRIWIVANTDNKGLERYNDRTTSTIQTESTRTNIRTENISNGGKYWSAEPDVGRVAHGVSSRVDRLKSLGNAIVPQIAFELFKVIDKIERDE